MIEESKKDNTESTDISNISSKILEDIEDMDMTLKNYVKELNDLLEKRYYIEQVTYFQEKEIELLKELIYQTEYFLFKVKSKIDKPI